MITKASAEATEVPLDSIRAMREQYRAEMNCQIVHDSWHARGFTTSYLLCVGGEVAGYGSVGGPPRAERNIVKEFFVLPPHRGAALPLFRELVRASDAGRIEAQTNDPLLLLMLYDCATGISSETILFGDRLTTDLPAPEGAVVRQLLDSERHRVFEHTREPVGDWAVELHGSIAATGGLAFHYNPPYADIYMEVAADHRRRGIGSYLVQELKRISRDMECIPAARCNQANVPSRLALERAGMLPIARVLEGVIVPRRPGPPAPTGKSAGQ